MRWWVHAGVQKAFAMLPFGGQLHHVCQLYITKSIGRDERAYREVFRLARAHVEAFRRWTNKPLSTVVFYEFGAGFDLSMPLYFWAMGVDHQIAIDRRRLVRFDLVDRTIEMLAAFRRELGVLRVPRIFISNAKRPLECLERHYGIRYLAPCDAGHTGLAPCTVDLVTSTYTLEHVPRGDIPAILRECQRLLVKDALGSFMIDYQDHHSFGDGSISEYNFLRFSERTWALFNSPLNYQNRMRHSDYERLFENSNFAVLEQELRQQEGDPATLASIRLDDRFAGYPVEVLAVRGAHFVFRKAAV